MQKQTRVATNPATRKVISYPMDTCLDCGEDHPMGEKVNVLARKALARP